ncbi:MAG: hypothetical protein ASARMPRED_008163 [Alectoria sarmentosa]|nr:MAG: hypothetical protein ASARMPRED_008163 [Alectoria sarmentosa]
MATVRQRSTNSNIDNKSNEDDDVVTNKHSLLDWDDLEPWQQDNEHILSHYRSPSHNHWKSITSLAYLHNQTGNIYSHLLGTVAFLMLAFSLDYEFSDYYSRQDRILIACFLLGTIFCFGSSTYFHLSGNHSAEVYHAWLTMDFFGIITLITGTAFPLAYYSYPCHQITLKLCWISVTVIAILCTVLVFGPTFRQRSWRHYRAAVFVLFALIGFFPLFHSLSLHGLEHARRLMGWSWFFAGGLSYVSGALIYAARFPESLKPGAFDIWGHSHQTFHVMVVLGAVLHFNGILRSLQYHHDPITRVVRDCKL